MKTVFNPAIQPVFNPLDGPFQVQKIATLPGASGDFFSTPDSVAASITGSIDIRVKLAMTDWTPAAASTVISKFLNTGSQRSYEVEIITTGAIRLGTSVNGIATVVSTSTAATGFTDGAVHWIRVTWNDATDVANYFTSTNGTDWTQLGAADVAHVSAGIFDSTALVNVGGLNNGTAQVMAGEVYRAQILNGIAGTVAVDFNPNDYDSGSTFTSSTTGEVWTINGNATIV